MRFSEFNVQSWGYASGLLALPFFFLFSHFRGEASGIFAAIVVAGCLLIARTNHQILNLRFGKIILIGCAIVGIFISAFVRAQTTYMVLIEGVAFSVCVRCLCVALIRHASHKPT